MGNARVEINSPMLQSISVAKNHKWVLRKSLFSSVSHILDRIETECEKNEGNRSSLTSWRRKQMNGGTFYKKINDLGQTIINGVQLYLLFF